MYSPFFKGRCLQTGDSCRINMQSYATQSCSFLCPELSEVEYTCSVNGRNREVVISINGGVVFDPQDSELTYRDVLTSDSTDILCAKYD